MTDWHTRASAALLALGGVLVSGCGGAADNPQMVEEFTKQCKSEFTKQGGPANLADPFCECSTRKVKEQDLGPMDMFDQEKMEAIGLECGKEVVGGATEGAMTSSQESE